MVGSWEETAGRVEEGVASAMVAIQSEKSERGSELSNWKYLEEGFRFIRARVPNCHGVQQAKKGKATMTGDAIVGASGMQSRLQWIYPSIYCGVHTP